MKKIIIMMILLLAIILFVACNPKIPTGIDEPIKEPIKVDDVFPELKSNDMIGATAIFSIDNKEEIIAKEDLVITFNEVCGRVKSYEVLEKTICYESLPIYVNKEVCEETVNGTECADIQTIKGYTNTSYDCYETITGAITSKDYKVNADIEWETCDDGTYGYKIDWIPKLTIDSVDYEQVKWAWWNTTYTYKRSIDCTNMDSDMPMVLNGSEGVGIDGLTQNIWTRCYGTGMALYYNNNESYVVANDTERIPFTVELGNGTSYNSTDVFNNFKVAWLNSENSGDIKDYTSTGNDGTVSGYLYDKTGMVDGAVESDGNSDKVTFSDIGWNNASSDRTYFACFNITDYTTGSEPYDRIINDGETSSYFSIQTANTDTSIRGSYKVDGSWDATAEISLTEKDWYCTSFVFDFGTDVKVYVNGELNITDASLGSAATSGADKMTYGYTSVSNSFKGVVDTVLITEKSLSSDQNNDLYNSIIGASGYGSVGAEETQGAVQNAVNATMCSSMNELSYFPDLSDFNFTDNTVTASGVVPDNVTSCSYTYMYSVNDTTTNVTVRLNTTIVSKFVVKVGAVTLDNTTWVSVKDSPITDTIYYVNVTLDYIKANYTDASENSFSLEWEVDQ